jgi:hypothetical protein
MSGVFFGQTRDIRNPVDLTELAADIPMSLRTQDQPI